MVLKNSVIDECMERDGVVVCVKDRKTKVLQQNDACHKLCGDLLGKECHIACMELYEKDDSQQWEKWGSRTYRNCPVQDQFFDITVISTSEHITTFAQPLNDKLESAMEYYRNSGLTKRELEVIELAIVGMSNQEISEKLFISTATLRSHLKNIYNRVKEVRGSVEYLPFERKQQSNNYYSRMIKI